MKTFSILVISGLLMISIGYAQVEKTYKHAEEYQVGVVDQDVQAVTGTDATISSTSTDAKLSGGGEGIHILHTEAGTYRVEAPTNSGLTVLAALGNNNRYGPAPTIHNNWFLDHVEPGTKLLFAAKCAKNHKHPNKTVRCTFLDTGPR